jgi:predicted GNAT family acetyltransferase
MKINQVLVEAEGATVAFAFGRFNPAHQGHIEVWRTVEDSGKNWFVGTNPTTIGPNDPLTFEQKSEWMEEIYPPIQGHIVAQTTVLSLAAYIFNKLRKNENATIAYVTDDTDWAWSGKLLNQYNGVEGSHGYYKFAQIIHVPSPRVSSATALRDAARADDRVAFYHASGTDPKLKVAGKSYFDTVKEACEKYPLPVKRAKKVKEPVVAEAINPDILNPKFSHRQEIGDFTYTASTEQAKQYRWEPYPGAPVFDADTNPYYIVTWLNIKCFDNNKQIALAIFEVKGNEKNQQWLESYQTSVDKSYRGRGIASSMYAYAKMLGNDVKPSSSQSDQGRSMWKAWKKSGDAKHLTTMSTPVGENTEQKTVAKTWDQMTPQEKISGVKGRTVWNEKTRKYYTVFDVPAKQETTEASLATMRDYFAGDEKARDPYEITKQRLHFSKDKDKKPTVDKRFRSQEEYEQWLIQNHLKHITPIKEDEEAGEVKKTGQLIPFPAGTTKVHVSDVYDWYKLGMVISDLDDADPKMFGQGAPQTVIAFGSEEEESKLLPLLSRLGLKVDDIDLEYTDIDEAYDANSLYEMLTKKND